MKTNELRKHRAPLLHVYPGRSEPQGAYVEIRPDGDLSTDSYPEVSADWNGEIGNAVPLSVWHGRTLRFRVAATVKGTILADFLESEPARALFARIKAGYSETLDGSNHKGCLSGDAQDASADLQAALDALENEGDCVATWLTGDWLDASTRGRGTEKVTIEGIGDITAKTTDAELESMAGAVSKAADEEDMELLDDPATWLRKLRDEIPEDEAEEKPPAYLTGFDDGAEAARDREAEIMRDGGDPAREMLPLTRETGAEKWDADLINALGADEAAKHLGLTSIYQDGTMTEEARQTCDDYNRGATAGWNEHVAGLKKEV